MRLSHRILTALLLATLIGCGGPGAGGGATAGSGGTTPPPSDHGQALGTRAVPGSTVTVASDGPLQAGAAARFHLSVSTPVPVPLEVRAWIGGAYDPAIVGIQATPVAIGTYDVTVPIPSPIPIDSHVWVRMVFADGSVIETGREDFMLVQR
ncbi:MAG: hypothetical protein H0X38_11575 [Planctomycetes bacterium]|nr:hypothetical protein [Planctomycetota bacterium]